MYVRLEINSEKVETNGYFTKLTTRFLAGLGIDMLFCEYYFIGLHI